LEVIVAFKSTHVVIGFEIYIDGGGLLAERVVQSKETLSKAKGTQVGSLKERQAV